MSSKINAIFELARDMHRNPKPTRTSYLRCVKACADLGLTDEERIQLLSSGYLGYIDSNRELKEKFRKKS